MKVMKKVNQEVEVVDKILCNKCGELIEDGDEILCIKRSSKPFDRVHEHVKCLKVEEDI